jgi:formate hydrogenlyase subunit 3/multisubunit Na+/H+ antiporter MnhD subunit
VSAPWLVALPLLPLIAAALAWHRRGGWLAPAAALPALVTAAVVPAGAATAVPWLMLGTELRLDATGRVFLLFSALLWLVSAVYGLAAQRDDPLRGRFLVFFLLAMGGNFALILAADMGTFFFGFALMGLATYGLVAHRPSAGARRAGRIYLGWTIAGEVALFSGVVLLAGAAGGHAFDALSGVDPSPAAVALVLLGFGIKLALPGLHAWLPLAYRAAPAAGAAVMSGAMIKAGALGIMRFLPAGSDHLAAWGEVLVPLGVFAAFFGVAVGLAQRSPRVVLGYSSVSQMGVIAAALGVGLAAPDAAAALAAAVTVYAAHHALAKGALFLGLDALRRNGGSPWMMAGLALPALALAGAPFTSGALAKAALGEALPVQWAALQPWLTAGAAATTLLMARLLWLAAGHPARSRRPLPRAAAGAWVVLLAAIAAWPVVLAEPVGGGAVPLLAGVLIGAGAVLAARRGLVPRAPRIPTGDLPVLLGHHLGRLSRLAIARWQQAPQARVRRRTLARLRPRLPRLDAEAVIRRWSVAGLLWLGLTAWVWLLSLR